MKNLLQYAGSILILLATVLLAATFFTDALIDADTNHVVLLTAAIMVVLGVVLAIVLGRKGNQIKD